MPDATAQFQGSIPQHYAEHMVPVIFESYAEDLARRIAPAAGPHVLETACGTGVLTRRLRKLLPASTQLTATDLNPAMLDYARVIVGDSGISWEQADAAALPFPPMLFSAVACQFGVMFVPDKTAVFREARRVMQRDGLLAFNVWDSFDANPFARLAHETVAELFPADPPKFFLTPFGFHDTTILNNLLVANAFTDVRIERLKLDARSDSAESFATGLIKGTPISAAIQERGASLDGVVAAVADRLAQEGGSRPYVSTMQAIIATARAV